MSMQNGGYNKDGDKPITFPLWQMMHEEEEAIEEEDRNEKFNCLTSRVRACYLRNLEKILLNNYELCSEEERSAFPFSREHIIKAAEQLECRALRSCMVVILYQRAMMRLTTDIKKHTQQLKLYRRLQEIINSNNGWQDKEIQTTRECFLTDEATQTDPEETPIIKSEPPEDTEKLLAEALCTEAQPIPVLVSGVAISKPFPEPSAQQYNIFQSTSSQVANHNKENLVPAKTDKDKAYHKRNTKDLASRETKINSPPKRPCLRVRSLSSLQKSVVANGAIPPLPTVPLSDIMDDHVSKKSIVVDKQNVLGNQITEAVPDIPLPPSPPPAIENPNQSTVEDSVEAKLSVVFSQTTNIPCFIPPSPPAVNIQPLPATPCAAPEQVQAEEDDGHSSPRMSIEERLALVFNIPTDTVNASSPSQKQRRYAAKGSSQRRMSIEERLEAVFRGETINDEDVQSLDGEDNFAEQANESMETLKYEAVPQNLVAPPHLKLRFIELFGHESDGEEEDDDNEPPYKDKIARWVVECLMPYYRHKLIVSRPLFKRLARHIADTVMISKPLPDKSDVDDCVTEFFSRHSCVSSERDIN